LAKDFGKLDIVFANASISARTPTGSTNEAIFEKVIHADLNGAFFTVNSAAPLLNDNGSIIFNGSVHNYLGQPGTAVISSVPYVYGGNGHHYRLRNTWAIIVFCFSKYRPLFESGLH
jgi:NAD(P)-dependent dehydrogenase (short-subunit alcohol dehydrogenase family)